MATYTTNFSLGDIVFGISNQTFTRIIRCKVCGNTGKINITGEDLICPKCNGRSTTTEYAGEKFYVSEFDATIGKVLIAETSLIHRWSANESPFSIQYMISNTGIGTGQVWPQDRLFSSLEEAQKFCDIMNGVLPKDECPEGKPILDSYGRVL